MEGAGRVSLSEKLRVSLSQTFSPTCLQRDSKLVYLADCEEDAVNHRTRRSPTTGDWDNNNTTRRGAAVQKGRMTGEKFDPREA